SQQPILLLDISRTCPETGSYVRARPLTPSLARRMFMTGGGHEVSPYIEARETGPNPSPEPVPNSNAGQLPSRPALFPGVLDSPAVATNRRPPPFEGGALRYQIWQQK